MSDLTQKMNSFAKRQLTVFVVVLIVSLFSPQEARSEKKGPPDFGTKDSFTVTEVPNERESNYILWYYQVYKPNKIEEWPYALKNSTKGKI